MTSCPDKALLLHAYVDDELDAASSVALEEHLRKCTACAEELSRVRTVRSMLANSSLRYEAPAALETKIEAKLRQPKPEVGWRPWDWARSSFRPLQSQVSAVRRTSGFGRGVGGGLVAGLALGLMAMVAMPQIIRPGLEDQYVASHIRSLSLESHLTDVATSNRHVVKPWFNGKIDFAPRVPELAAQGFPLVGGRLDYIDGHQVAAIVYKRRLHTINLFVQPAGTLSLPFGSSDRHEGYSLVRWTDSGLEYWAVSDVDLRDLESFRRAFDSQPSL